jgi:hypothetical protein
MAVCDCIWTKDVITLLPKTDLVHFFDAEKKKMVAIAEWDRVVEIVGDLMLEQGMYPERYLVQDFPTGEQLGWLGKLSF